MDVSPKLLRSSVLPALSVVGIAACLLTSCRARPLPAEAHVTLGADLVARVGDETLPASLVAAVAAANKETPQEAVKRLVEDALAAQEARARGLDTTFAGKRDLVALHARLVAERLRADALAKGAPTDEEVAELSKVHAREVDVPESVLTIHAIVTRGKEASPVGVAAARAIAAELERSVAHATSADDFEARARAVSHPGLELKTERLPGFASTGELIDAQGSMDPTFASAAFALPTPGATSHVVETPFGWHVIRLLERLPAKHVPFEERRALFADEVIAGRARRAYDPLLAKLRQSTAVEIHEDADQLMAPLLRAAVDGASTPP